MLTLQTTIRAGRIIGVLIILQLIGGYVVNFVLEEPLFGSPGFLVNAASHARQLGVGALLGLVVEAFWVGIAVASFSILEVRARPIAIGLMVLAAVVLAAASAECAAVMSMVSVSDAYNNASAAGREQLEAVRVIVASSRNWVHYVARLLDGIIIFIFYAGLYRAALVPRWINGFGFIAVLLMIVGITMPFFGHDVVFPLLAPLGLSQLIVSVWLVAKGFREPSISKPIV